MDKEFHYYITYLIAARAGFDPRDAGIIAKTCQATDENTRINEVYSNGQLAYANYVSQTSDLLRPRASRMRIYPVFHFIPGDPEYQGAKRSDGRNHPLNTTPDSQLANQCIDEALLTEDLYQIGIACHAYADTWAHQNFVGYKDKFNKMEGVLEWVIPDLGHADAKHDPDWPAHIWHDHRLLEANRRVDNKQRFITAAGKVFAKLARFNGLANIEVKSDGLCRDLNITLGKAVEDSRNRGKSYRIERYQVLAQEPEYGGQEIAAFELDHWLKECLAYDYNKRRYSWKDEQNYPLTHWYLFQEAIKKYQKKTLGFYENTVYADLPEGLKEEILEFS